MTTADTDYDSLEDDEATGPATYPLPDWAYPNCEKWFNGWFRHAIAGRFDNEHRWCAQWWRHNPVVLRVEEMWKAWESARLTDDPAALSAWWTGHADPHWRAITAEAGPLHLCNPREHTAGSPLAVTPTPPGWLDVP